MPEHISRRQLIGTAAGTALTIGAGATITFGQAPAAPAVAGPPDLIVTNGRIHTMNAANTIAASASIANGRFQTVGDRAPARGPATRVIDLRGEPWSRDRRGAHPQREPGQPPRLSHDPREHGIDSGDSGNAGRAAQDVPDGQWITSMGGWHPNQWAERRHPTLKELDDAVPDRPVLLYERFTGPCVTNSLGKKLFDARDAAPKVHPNVVRRERRPTTAPSPRRGSPAEGRRRRPCSTCAACRPSTTGSAARRCDGLLGERRV